MNQRDFDRVNDKYLDLVDKKYSELIDEDTAYDKARQKRIDDESMEPGNEE